MRVYTIYVINGVNSFERKIECEYAIPTPEGYYQFYNLHKDGKTRLTEATYPIAMTAITEISKSGAKSETSPASADNRKINNAVDPL